jgi:hypothetical protein
MKTAKLSFASLWKNQKERGTSVVARDAYILIFIKSGANFEQTSTWVSNAHQ